MLILPLHRPFSRANFPFATIALVLANVFVFLFLQGPDDALAEKAMTYYGQTGLGRVEMPLYQQWLQQHPDKRREEMLARLGDEGSGLVGYLIQHDAAFLAELRGDRLITPADERYAQWKPARSEFDRLWSLRFEDRHVLHYSELEPARLFSAMFLHGDFGHLFGNMLFLVLLGLLVEGALGPGLFLAVYLLGGVGGSLFSLWWRWGDSGAMLGASGAIAALMGAYCVLWGLRKVRVFWWAFVVFDYSRITALWLLPFWLGWELFNLLANGDAGVGFDAHAGGIMSGALLAWGVRALGWERRDFLDEDVKADAAQAHADTLKLAHGHLGKLEVVQARKLLEELDQAGPPSLDVRVALYRCARYARQPAALREAVKRVLELPLVDAATVHKVKSVLDDFRKVEPQGLALEPAQQLQLARAWFRIGAQAEADQLLGELAARAPDQPGLAELCWQLAQRAREGSAEWRARLDLIVRHCPGSALAPKARFLLSQA
ncbi:rhomboid family intramembrane serine protease [Tahibacter harae]|uniref:Rhomboid family intramembrane serine protease n=1 Tax=Tahibacter harae TaxID=2963937 RepID=A0ABT1QWZ9_9GAMM|nr:rhomboid family intramembrane serine protease [Tahibacter harae]MCQ4166810.1 rhomboid family intramembrane serine protease [Tahibacter harae]